MKTIYSACVIHDVFNLQGPVYEREVRSTIISNWPESRFLGLNRADFTHGFATHQVAAVRN